MWGERIYGLSLCSFSSAAHDSILLLAEYSTTALKKSWFSAVLLGVGFWIFWMVIVLMRKTAMSRWMFWLNPLVLGFLITLFLSLLPSNLGRILDAAVFNISNFIFYAILLYWLYANRTKLKESSRNPRIS